MHQGSTFINRPITVDICQGGLAAAAQAVGKKNSVTGCGKGMTCRRDGNGPPSRQRTKDDAHSRRGGGKKT